MCLCCLWVCLWCVCGYVGASVGVSVLSVCGGVSVYCVCGCVCGCVCVLCLWVCLWVCGVCLCYLWVYGCVCGCACGVPVCCLCGCVCECVCGSIFLTNREMWVLSPLGRWSWMYKGSSWERAWKPASAASSFMASFSSISKLLPWMSVLASSMTDCNK